MGDHSMIDTSVLQQNPFPGIRPFNSAEDKYFFGRDGLIGDVIDLLQDNRFVALVGASASGKTSLVQSGIIPTLISQEHQEWVPVSIRPGLKPVEELIRGFQKVFPKKIKNADVQAFLNGSQSLGELIVDKGLGSHNYFLVVDQFEDLFRPGPDAKPRAKSPETRRFIDLLVKAAMDARPGIYVLLSIRSDFIDASSNFRPLTELMNRSKFILPQMSREALLECVSAPVKQEGVRFESGFLDFLMEDLEDLEYAMPKLQHAMKRTWDHWMAQGDREQPISIGDYQAVGTVESALQDHLEEAFAELSGLQKLSCERLFKSITSKSEQQSGFRRQASLASIARIANASVEDLADVVEVFRKPGRAFLLPADQTPLGPDTLIELSHESLIMVWDRLRQWVEEEDESIRMYLKLSDASAKYQQGRSELWVDPQLQLALEWRDSQKPTPAWGVQYHPAFERAMVFLKTSEEERLWEEERKVIQQKRRLLINRGVAIFMGALVIILGTVFVLTRTGAVALPETEEAIAQDLSPQAEDPVNPPQAERNLNPVTQTEEDPLASETLEQSPVPVEPRVERTQAQNTQTQNTQAQNTQARNTQARNTRTPDPVSTTNRNTNASSTTRAGMSRSASLNLAREVAANSMSIEQNPELQGLLAYQAYQLSTEARGSALEPDIYNGLYAAMKKLISPAYNMYQGIRTSVKDIHYLRRTGSILIACSDGSMKILSGNYTSASTQISLKSTGQKNECLLVSPDEKLAVVGTNGAGLLFLELESQGNVIQQNSEEGAIVLFLSKLGNSGEFVSAGTDKRILKWDFQFGQAKTLLNTPNRVSALAASRNGQRLAYATRDGKLYELEVDEPGRQQLIGDYGKVPARAITYSPSGQSMVVGLRDGTLRVMTGMPRKNLRTLRGPSASVTDLSYSPDGKYLAASSNDGNVYLWNAENWGAAPLVFDENNGFVLSVCFSANSNFFYSGSVDFPRLVGRPSESSVMAENFCNLLDRNLSPSEWEQYFGSELPYRETCPK